MTNEIKLQEHNNVSLGFMIFDSLPNAIKCADIIAKSNICPKDYKDKPNDVLVAVQFGAEVGLTPLQALQNIAVINGRPALWGDAMLALCKQKDDFEYIKEEFDREKYIATCTLKRKGEPEHIQTFSMKDAEAAGLHNKQGPWKQYPFRMCQLRARGFALRNVFPHHLKGLKTAEEVRDEELLKDVTPKSTIENLIKNKKKVNQNKGQVIEAEFEPKFSREQVIEDIGYLIEAKIGGEQFVQACLKSAQVNDVEQLDEEKLKLMHERLISKEDK